VKAAAGDLSPTPAAGPSRGESIVVGLRTRTASFPIDVFVLSKIRMLY